MHRPIVIVATFCLIVANVTLADDAPDHPFRPTAVATDGVPPIPPHLIDQLRTYQSVRSASFAGFALDGTGILVSTRFGNSNQLHRVYEPGGRREQVTFFDEPVDGRFLPGQPAESLLLSIGTGGNEAYQIYRQEHGASTLLTDGRSRHLLGPVAEDGSFFIMTGNPRSPESMDVLLGRPDAPGEHETLLQVETESWFPTKLSPDGSKLLMIRYVSINESYPAVLEIASKRLTPIAPPAGAMAAKISYGSLVFSPDGEAVYATCDGLGEFRSLARIDLASGNYVWLSDEIPWNVEEVEVHAETGQVAFVTNDDGAGGLYLLEDDTPRRLDLPLGIISGLEFSPDGTALGFTLSRPNAPADAFTVRIDDGDLEQWTFSEVGGLDAGRFVVPERISFPTFDDRKIPAYYFKPRSASADRPAPVLINIHGGPESQYRPFFSSIDQFYLNELGIAVLRPNVRGSNGYGKTYLQLDNAERREDSVRDIGAILDWVEQQPELDASHVAVYGGSYGGYMVLASLTHFPDRIRAGVDVVGIASFTTFLKNTSSYRQDLRRAEYGDERDPAMQAVFARINPLGNAARIRSSLLVAHGVNDPRVPFSEAEQIAPMVRDNGVDVWTVYADNEGHGFRRRDNRDYLDAVIVMFLREHLLGRGD